ncbi:hypothetical protein MAL08_07040 [Leptospira noguchii]|uniref:hypothetical protein n=1 Tax=Leptospira noguchii TaxID=28182 RepID=UPI001FB80849|nr:hypothetical protein [Leptospira noguchii]UOG39029.1 hypothetical protein MAL08_07040 [Leptospira noguchii]
MWELLQIISTEVEEFFPYIELTLFKTKWILTAQKRNFKTLFYGFERKKHNQSNS